MNKNKKVRKSILILAILTLLMLSSCYQTTNGEDVVFCKLKELEHNSFEFGKIYCQRDNGELVAYSARYARCFLDSYKYKCYNGCENMGETKC